MGISVEHIMMGEIKLLGVTGTKSLVPIDQSTTDFAVTLDIETSHKVGDGHQFNITIIYQVLTKKDEILLQISSLSKFKIVPFDSFINRKPVSPRYVNIITEMAKTAQANNNGMFAILKKDFNLSHFNCGMLALPEIRQQVETSLNKG